MDELGEQVELLKGGRDFLFLTSMMDRCSIGVIYPSPDLLQDWKYTLWRDLTIVDHVFEFGIFNSIHNDNDTFDSSRFVGDSSQNLLRQTVLIPSAANRTRGLYESIRTTPTGELALRATETEVGYVLSALNSPDGEERGLAHSNRRGLMDLIDDGALVPTEGGFLLIDSGGRYLNFNHDFERLDPIDTFEHLNMGGAKGSSRQSEFNDNMVIWVLYGFPLCFLLPLVTHGLIRGAKVRLYDYCTIFAGFYLVSGIISLVVVYPLMA